eukprot:7087-Hanusia_phi.AAC.1
MFAANEDTAECFEDGAWELISFGGIIISVLLMYSAMCSIHILSPLCLVRIVLPCLRTDESYLVQDDDAAEGGKAHGSRACETHEESLIADAPAPC